MKYKNDYGKIQTEGKLEITNKSLKAFGLLKDTKNLIKIENQIELKNNQFKHQIKAEKTIYQSSETT